MAVPRVNWVIEDDCLAPEARLRVDYAGPNPFKVVQLVKETMRRVLEVEAQDFWERDFRWDMTQDPRGFFVRSYVVKGFDLRTSIFCEVVMQGQQPSDPTKNGKVTIYIGGKVRTMWELSTAFQHLPIYKGLIWVYHKLFYNKVRRGYISMCISWVETLWKEFREVLEIAPENVAAERLP